MIIGHEISAEDYCVNRWIKMEIWKKLKTKPHQERLKIVSSLLIGESAIDVGCACGHSIEHMRKFRPGFTQWAGLDFSKTVIEKAKEFFPDIPFYYAKDFNLKDACGEFDTVTCLGTIEHIEDDEGLVRGLLDITKRTLILETPARKFGGDHGHVRFYSPGDFQRLFGDYFYIVLMKWPHYFVVVMKENERTKAELLRDFSRQCGTLFHHTEE